MDLFVLKSPESFIRGKAQLATYGSSAEFIHTGNYAELEQPHLEEFNLEGTTPAMRTHLFQNALEAFLHKQANEGEIRRKIFAQIMLVLDSEGREMVETSYDFANLNIHRNDPLALFNLVERVYYAGKRITANVTNDIKQAARIDYERFSKIQTCHY